MQALLQMPVLSAVFILSLVYGALAYSVASATGLKELAVFVASMLGTVFLSGADTLRAMIVWFKGFQQQARIWAICTLAMTLFLAYRRFPRLEVALVEAVSTAVFFMAMVAIGNRFTR